MSGDKSMASGDSTAGKVGMFAPSRKRSWLTGAMLLTLLLVGVVLGSCTDPAPAPTPTPSGSVPVPTATPNTPPASAPQTQPTPIPPPTASPPAPAPNVAPTPPQPTATVLVPPVPPIPAFPALSSTPPSPPSGPTATPVPGAPIASAVPTATIAVDLGAARQAYPPDVTRPMLAGDISAPLGFDGCVAEPIGQAALNALRTAGASASGEENDVAAGCLLLLGYVVGPEPAAVAATATPVPPVPTVPPFTLAEATPTPTVDAATARSTYPPEVTRLVFGGQLTPPTGFDECMAGAIGQDAKPRIFKAFERRAGQGYNCLKGRE